jgi:hypothetical protein
VADDLEAGADARDQPEPGLQPSSPLAGRTREQTGRRSSHLTWRTLHVTQLVRTLGMLARCRLVDRARVLVNGWETLRYSVCSLAPFLKTCRHGLEKEGREGRKQEECQRAK